VSISVDGARRLGALQFDLRFDPAVLEAKSVAIGDLLEQSQGAMEFNPNEPGRLRVAIASPRPIKGDGELLQASFLVKGANGATSPIKVEVPQAWQSDTYVEILVLPRDGMFTVKGKQGTSSLLWIILIAVLVLPAVAAHLLHTPE